MKKQLLHVQNSLAITLDLSSLIFCRLRDMVKRVDIKRTTFVCIKSSVSFESVLPCKLVTWWTQCLSTLVLVRCDASYQLRAVINHKPGHFVATVIGQKTTPFYVFDDLSGVQQVRQPMDSVETGIYTLFDETFDWQLRVLSFLRCPIKIVNLFQWKCNCAHQSPFDWLVIFLSVSDLTWIIQSTFKSFETSARFLQVTITTCDRCCSL